MKSKIIFFDTETTGEETGNHLIQIAYKEYGTPLADTHSLYFKPKSDITFSAMAIHHITPEMVADKDLFESSTEYQGIKELFEDEQSVVIAHNAPFDIGVLRKENIFPKNVIDTLKVAHHIDDKGEIKSKSLQYLRYAWGIDKMTDIKIDPHDAKSDVIVLELLFNYMTKSLSNSSEASDELIQKMIEISNEPIVFHKFTFGKHNGKLITEVAKTDRGYLEWLLKQKQQPSEQDESGWILTLTKALNSN